PRFYLNAASIVILRDPLYGKLFNLGLNEFIIEACVRRTKWVICLQKRSRLLILTGQYCLLKPKGESLRNINT
ncbi:hypothetical protein KI387_009718, partial [Taxus chinensis]